MKSRTHMKKMVTWLTLIVSCTIWRPVAQAATLHIEPANVTLAIGEKKLVQVMAEAPAPANASDPVGLAAFQFTATFDAAKVNVSNPNELFRDANIPPYAPLGDNRFCTFVRGTTTCPDPAWFLTSTGRAATGHDERTSGRVQVAYATSGSQTPPTGTGVVALLELVGQANGCTALSLTDVILADNSGVPRKYDTTVRGAQVCVGAVTCTPGSEQACYSGPDATKDVGVCRAGVRQCLPDGSGYGPCQGEVVPSTEVCNNKDDDCDGQTDEALGEVSCGVGECRRTVAVCENGAPGVCEPGLPQTETCNNKDDNCNGTIDDGFGTVSCGVGACFREVAVCEAGQGQTCTPGTPGQEGPQGDPSCANGIDDDCDGAADTADTNSCGSEPLALIPGGGTGKTDCILEWFVQNPNNPLDKKGFPDVKQSCVDGDPTCDADEISGQCTFLVTSCLNVDDDRLVDRKDVRICFPSDVVEVDVEKARSLEPAFVALGGDAAGLCSKGRKGALCDTNTDCETAPGAGDGKCKGRSVFFMPPVASETCTEAARIVVPLKQTPRGFKKASTALQTEAVTSVPVGEKKGVADPDGLSLTCLPRTDSGLATDSADTSEDE